jgi:hypothetical protein
MDGDLDLSNSTGNLTLSSLSSAPSSPTVGDTYYDSTLAQARVYQAGGWSAMDGTAAGSLDAAYNGGGTITVDGGAVTLTDSQTDTTGGFLINKTGVVTGTDSADVLYVNSSGAHDTTGRVSLLRLNMQTETATTPEGARITMNANSDNAIKITKGAVILDDGALTLTSGALTLSSGNLDVTGTGTFSGTLTASGALSVGTTLALAGVTTAQASIIIDADHAEAFLVRENADAADVLTVDTTQDAGDTTMLLTTKVTTGTGLHVDGSTITTGDAVKITVAAATMTAAGAALSVVADGTEVFAVRDDGSILSVTGTAEGTTALGVTTGDVVITDGDLTLSGGEAVINDGVTTSGSGLTLTSTITTSTAGAFLVTGNSLTSGTMALFTTSGTVTGTVLGITASGLTTGTVLDMSAAALTTGKVIDISDLDAITSGKAIHIDATGTTQTSGVLVHIDSASTGITTSGRLLLVDATGDFNDTGGAVVEIQSVHTTGVGLLMTMDAVTDGFGLDMTADGLTSGAGVRLVSSSTGLTTAGNILYVQASGDFNDAGAAVVEIESAHTTGVGLLMTMDAVTDGFGLDMTADALTSGAGARFISSSTALTTGGNVVYIQAGGDFDAAGGQVVEIESAHTTGTGLQLTMDAATDGLGMYLTADALTSGAGVSLNTSSAGLTTGGNVLYVGASGDFNDAGGQVVEIESVHTTGTGLQLTMDAITDGIGMFMTVDALTSGQGVSIASSATAITGAGRLLRVDHTGATGTNAILSEFASAGDDETTILRVTASDVLAGGVMFDLSGAAMTTGTAIDAGGLNALTTGIGLNIASTATAITGAGRLVYVNHAGATSTNGILNEFTTAATDETVNVRITASAAISGEILDISAVLMADGTAIDISNLAAITSGKAIHVDATGTTQTSGVLVHLDSASTSLTTGGRILLADMTGDFNDTGGAVVEIKSVHTTGVGLLMTMDAVTDGFGLDMTADALTSGAGARFISSSTSLTTAGNVLYVQASGDFNDAGGQVVEIESAHTTGTGLQLTMNAVTDGLGLSLAANALVDGAGVSLISSSTALTTAGNILYVQASGDFDDAGGQVVEIESAHTTGTGVQLTMDAATDGLGMFMTADALSSGKGVEITSSSTALTTAGNLLHVSATGDFDDAGGQVVEIESVHTTGTLLQLTGNAITDGIGVDLAVNALTTGTGIDMGGMDAVTSGKAVNIQSTGEAFTSGILLDVGHSGDGGNAAMTGNVAKFASSIDDTDTSGTATENYDVVLISRTDIMNGAGGTLDADGALLKLESTATQTAGTLTVDTSAIEISHNTRSASVPYAITITHNNAGAGSPGGIDMSSFSVDEPIIKFKTDATGSSKSPETVSQDDWLCVADDSNNLRFIPCYAAS